MEDNWISVDEQPPNDGEIVDTKIDDWMGIRNEQPLKKQGNIWYVPNGEIYVYYRPTHWKSIKNNQP